MLKYLITFTLLLFFASSVVASVSKKEDKLTPSEHALIEAEKQAEKQFDEC
jgi:hypothetical protein